MGLLTTTYAQNGNGAPLMHVKLQQAPGLNKSHWPPGGVQDDGVGSGAEVLMLEEGTSLLVMELLEVVDSAAVVEVIEITEEVEEVLDGDGVDVEEADVEDKERGSQFPKPA
jgi:hypothetical protein